MKLLGIVILYYPENDIIDNINSYLHVLDELIIWDNTPGGSNTLFPGNSKIKRMGLNENAGIGTALNEAVRYAQDHGFTHLLTMDQDSTFETEDNIQAYIRAIIQSGEKAIFSPNYTLNNKVRLYPEQDKLIEVTATMTSGSIYPIRIFNKTGLFREDFFIDSVDIEFSLRARKCGISTKIVTFVSLNHTLGHKFKLKILWKTYFPHEYSPVRLYYIVRNGILVSKEYPLEHPLKGFLSYWFYRRLFRVLLLEQNKFAKCRALISGYRDGLKGKTGKNMLYK